MTTALLFLSALKTFQKHLTLWQSLNKRLSIANLYEFDPKPCTYITLQMSELWRFEDFRTFYLIFKVT